MFLIAGLLGLAAVGSVMMIGPIGEDDDDFEKTDAAEDELPDEDVGPGGMIEPAEFLEAAEEAGPFDTGPIDGTPGNDTLSGDDGASTINGGDGSDAIDGLGGDDALSGGGGEDWIWAGDGNDALHGGEDDDTLHGEAGEDTLYGDAGNDELFGHGGNDLILGGSGDDVLSDGMGNDMLAGQDGNDGLLGGHDDDTLDGGMGADSLFGGQGNDLLDGTESSADAPDYLNGNAGDDTILADDGDIVTGGEGADDIVFHGGNGQSLTLIDFEPQEDRLLIVVDDPSGGVEITLTPDATDAGLMHMAVDGEEVAVLRGAEDLTMNDITLVSEAYAAALEVLPPAA
ncbi:MULTISPECIES: calcium-binding protein [unclassified Marinovum]